MDQLGEAGEPPHAEQIHDLPDLARVAPLGTTIEIFDSDDELQVDTDVGIGEEVEPQAAAPAEQNAVLEPNPASNLVLDADRQRYWEEIDMLIRMVTYFTYFEDTSTLQALARGYAAAENADEDTTEGSDVGEDTD